METVELKLPVSGSIVVLRNYTTEADDEKAQDILYLGVATEGKLQKDSLAEQTLKFPVANIMASKKAYIPRLVKSIDDNSTNIALRLKELRSEDFAAISDAVDKIVDEHSPKQKEAKNASKNS